MSYCLCLGTWKTTLPSLLSTSCDYFWQMSHEHTGHLPLLVRSNGHWLCDYSDFLFLGRKCLGETHFLSWQNHRWKQSAFLFPKCDTGVAGEDEVNIRGNKTYFMSNQRYQAPHIMPSIYNNFYPVCKTVYLHLALSQCFDLYKSPCL